MRSLLFPDPPRAFPARRLTKISARAAHVLCAGVLVGSHLLQTGRELQDAWLTATVGSGMVLLAIDLHESAAFLLQVRGLVVVGKIGLILALPLLGGAAGYALAAALLVSVVLSHAPSGVRYAFFAGGGRMRGACSKG
jgi:hypothetical protein